MFVSALSGQRVTKIFDCVERVYAQYTRRVETGELEPEDPGDHRK